MNVFGIPLKCCVCICGVSSNILFIYMYYFQEARIGIYFNTYTYIHYIKFQSIGINIQQQSSISFSSIILYLQCF